MPQAAAEREQRAFHHDFGALSVRAYLRLQHARQHSLFSTGLVERPLLHSSARGCVSLDCTQAASRAGSKLLVRDLFIGQLLRQWDLPQAPAGYCPEAGWSWDGPGQHLTIPFGTVWRIPGMHCLQPPGQGAGMLHIDAGTGSMVLNRFQDRQWLETGWATAHACPRGSQLVVQAGFVDQEETIISVFSSAGELLQRRESRSNLEPVWAHCGQVFACQGMGDAMVQELWDRTAGALAAPKVSRFAWSTPFIADQFGMLMSGDAGCVVVVRAKQLDWSLLPAGAVQSDVCQLAWGSRLALLATTTELCLCSFLEGALTVEHTVTPRDGRHFTKSALALSADGQLCAAVTGHIDPQQHWLASSRYLAVMHLASGSLRELALHHTRLASGPDDCELRLCWTQDCSALLVSAKDASCHELFRF